MGYCIVGIIVISLVTVFTFKVTSPILKNKKGNITIDVAILKYFKFNLSANWENNDKEIHKNKKKKH